MRPTIALLLLVTIATLAPQRSLAEPVIAWIRQFGTPGSAQFSGGQIAADEHGNFFVNGPLYGNLSGVSAGGSDAYVNKYDAAGQLVWDRHFGTPADDGSIISADLNGNLYVGGSTGGDLAATNAGLQDMYLRKYSSAGDVLWTRQQGTALNDLGHGITADLFGNVYLTGGTQGAIGAPNQGFTDSVVLRYDASGNLVWTRQWGTAEREWAVAADTDQAGNIFALRYTQDQVGVPSSYELRKLDPSGSLLWSHPFAFGHFDLTYNSLATDADGNIYISAKAAFGRNGIFAKLSGEGQVLWSEDVSTRALSVDGAGNIYVSRGLEILKYNGSGAVLWTHQFADNSTGNIDHLSADGLGNLFVSGVTTAGLGIPLVGQKDVWLALVRDTVPEPSAVLLLAAGTTALLPSAARRRRVHSVIGK